MTKRIVASLVYSVALLVFLERCAYNDIPRDIDVVVVDCTRSGLVLSIESLKNSTGCEEVNGEIRVSAAGGLSPYNFSIDYGAYEANSTFDALAPGIYTVKVKDSNDCSTGLKINVLAEGSSLAVEASTKPDDQCITDNGSITMVVTEGTPPYSFSLNGGEFQIDPTFGNLAGGTYTVDVKDSGNCLSFVEVEVFTRESDLSATETTIVDDQCFTDNGSITVSARGGVPPYQYQLDNLGFGDSDAFSSIKNGKHVVLIKDAEACEVTLDVIVPRGFSGMSYVNNVKPILDTNCNYSPGCHGAGNPRDWTIYDNVRHRAELIKLYTARRIMPLNGELTQEEIDIIGCWVDDGALEN